MSHDSGCPSENKENQSEYWSPQNSEWDFYKIGWAIAGGCTLVTIIITIISVHRHTRWYTNRREQRQIIRILHMPFVYAIFCFLEYRFVRDYVYFELIKVVYEAISLASFMLLLVEYVASTTTTNNVQHAFSKKEKQKLLAPCCYFRYRPSKAYFMHTIKWLVLQFALVRPILSIVAIICEAKGILCESAGLNPRYANAYIYIIGLISMIVAMYGLFLFYALTKEEIKEKRPLLKFVVIKLIVFLSLVQGTIFNAFKGRLIHETEYFTETNLANAYNAMVMCAEMIVFSILMVYAFPATEYRVAPGVPKASVAKAMFDWLNFSDFAREIGRSLSFFVAWGRGDQEAHGHGHMRSKGWNEDGRPTDFGQAFGLPNHYTKIGTNGPNRMPPQGQEGQDQSLMGQYYDRVQHENAHPNGAQ